jgi:hypothetical protein
MLDELLEILFVQVVARILRVVLFPLALLVCTPFIFTRAVVLAIRQKTKWLLLGRCLLVELKRGFHGTRRSNQALKLTATRRVFTF